MGTPRTSVNLASGASTATRIALLAGLAASHPTDAGVAARPLAAASVPSALGGGVVSGPRAGSRSVDGGSALRAAAKPWGERAVLHWAERAAQEIPAGGHLAAAWLQEEPPVAAIAFIDQSGALATAYSASDSGWSQRNRVTVGGQGMAMPGGAVPIRAFFVGLDGAVLEARASLAPGGSVPAWSVPRAVTGTSFAPVAAKVAAVAIEPDGMEAIVVGVDGELHALASVEGGPYRERALSAGPGFAHGEPKGERWTCGTSSSSQWACANPGVAPMSGNHEWLVVSAIDAAGRFEYFVSQRLAPEGSSWGPWVKHDFDEEHPGSAEVFPSTADVASAQQFFYQPDAFVVDSLGQVNVMWMQEGAPVMNRTVVSSPGFAPPGAWLAAACEVLPGAGDGLAGLTPSFAAGCAGAWLTGQLDVLLVGNNGAVDVLAPPKGGAWLDARNDAAATSAVTNEMTSVRAQFVPGSPVAAAHRSRDTVDAFVAGPSAVELVSTRSTARSGAPLEGAPWNTVYQVY